MTLDYVVLLSDDVPRLRTFYRDVLELVVERDADDWVELRGGAATLALRPRGRPYDGPRSAGAGVQLAFRVELAELEVWEARLRARGIEPLEPVASHASGHRTLFLRDPDANVVELYALD